MNIQKAGYQGFWLPDLKIALDGYHAEAEVSFVSHAHSDHVPRNRRASVYATPPTVDLMQARGFNGKAAPLPYGDWIETDRFRARLYPAGHILGSAMVYIESESGSLLYTGDYRIPPSPASEGFEAPARADYLITEATFSLPIYRWKSQQELAEMVQQFAVRSLEDGFTPIFLAYSLGKTQEVMHLLSPLQLPAMVHGSAYNLCQIYESHGIPLGSYARYDRQNSENNVLIAPSFAQNGGFASHLQKTRIAYCSGWASNKFKSSGLHADALIPLSDHLDFFELIGFCKQLSPKKVYLTHTPNPKVVQHYLSNEGIESTHIK